MVNHTPSKKELVLKTKIKKEPDWVYHIDKNGNLRRGKIGAIPNHHTELVAELNIKREKGFGYLFQENGDIIKFPIENSKNN